MLVLQSLRQPCSIQLSFPQKFLRSPGTVQRRTFIQSLGNEFLDLALALPIPPSLPVYSTTIILVTVATRFALLPISIWGKRKSRTIEEVISPEISKMKPTVAHEVFQEMRALGMRGEKEYLKQHHQKRSQQILAARRGALFKKYNCQPWKAIILQPLSQFPIFVGFTMILSRLSMDPTPFDSETFLTLSTLARPDPTMTLPIALGVITMANVETNNWLLTATQKDVRKKVEDQRAKLAAEGKGHYIEPSKIIKTVLRGLSVLRIIIASITPGSVAIYWLTSATFGLFQSWVMDWFDYRRRKVLELVVIEPSSVSHTKSSTNRPLISRKAHHP